MLVCILTRWLPAISDYTLESQNTYENRKGTTYGAVGTRLHVQRGNVCGALFSKGISICLISWKLSFLSVRWSKAQFNSLTSQPYIVSVNLTLINTVNY